MVWTESPGLKVLHSSLIHISYQATIPMKVPTNHIGSHTLSKYGSMFTVFDELYVCALVNFYV